MPRDGAESIRIHRSIMEMLAFHYRPFSFVEDVCFLMTLSLLNASFVIHGADHFRTVILNDVYEWSVFTIMETPSHPRVFAAETQMDDDSEEESQPLVR